MSALCTLATSVPRGLSTRAATPSRCVAVRAEPESKAPEGDNTIFYGGSNYTEAEWAQAQQTGQYKSAPAGSGEPVPEEVATIGSLMAFDGAAPELINGRLAMLGFFAALGAEISTGEGVLMQLNDAPGPILVTFTLVAAATFFPLLQGVKPEARATGPFTVAAETLNGRAAMIGLVSLMVAELFTSGKAFL